LPKKFLRNFFPIDLDIGTVAGLAYLTHGCRNGLNNHIIFAHNPGFNPFNDACLMDIRYRPRAFAEFHESLVLIETDTAFRGLELDIQDGLGGGDGGLGGHGWCKLRGNNNYYLLWD
jgi:hypothetical protein